MLKSRWLSGADSLASCCISEAAVSPVLGVMRYLCNMLRNIITFVVTK